MDVEQFIAKWWGLEGGAERSNFAPFITDLCQTFDLPLPGPATKGVLGAYEYEGTVPGGSFRSLKAGGFIDLYRRGHFIMEAKQSYLKPEQQNFVLEDLPATNAPSGARYDLLMRDANKQAENYAKNLPGDHPPAPFLIVCDIGRAFEIYFDYSGNGRGYAFFPDKQNYRIELPALAGDKKIKGVDRTPAQIIQAVFTDPKSIDPRFRSAEVTRNVARTLAEVSRYLEEGEKHRIGELSPREKSLAIEETSLFLMRVLFCMFAEDIGLLPEDTFKKFLKRAEANDKLFANGLADLWHKMGDADVSPRFSHALEEEVRYFNGGLFESNRTYPLGGFMIHDLYEAARADWRRVEPAIFGTLLEQALTAEERAKLGAHYTPRPFVERLVRATIMDVLEAEWEAVEEAIEKSSPARGGGSRGETEGSRLSAPSPPVDSAGPLHHPADGPPPRAGEDLARAAAFHTRLAALRILDPACGTGNFLYVAMELLQQLESKVIERIETLGGEAKPLIGPQQFYGLELNPRAAKIAELVLWIGWLRNRLRDDPGAIPDPVLKRSASINFGRHGGYDAVLKQSETGAPDFADPSLPAWPEADFIVGNPPFIGGKDIRGALGGDYAEALWKANPRVPKSADFVMQWWDRAAHALTAEGSRLRRFGFVTTNSITQTFSRRVIERYLNPPRHGEGDQPQAGGGGSPETLRPADSPHHRPPGGPPPHSGEDRGLSLVLAIPDHPWTKATRDAAAVRIAMTVAQRGRRDGVLIEIVGESGLDTDNPVLEERESGGRINPDLSVGSDVTAARPLQANTGICHDGVKLHGKGFAVTHSEAEALGLGRRDGLERFIRPYRNGKDLVDNA